MALAGVTDRYSQEQINEFYRTGQWASERLWDFVLAGADKYGSRSFLTDDAESLSFVGLRDGAMKFGAALRALGVEPGDRVAVQLPNWVEFGVVVAALSRIGAILVPIMPIYRSDDVSYILENADVKLAITCGRYRGHDHAGMFTALQDEVPSLEHVVVVRGGEAPRSPHSFEALIEQHRDVSEDDLGAGVGPDEPMLIIYSSGTTSRPKGCVHTFNTVSCGARLLGQSFDYGVQDVQFGPSPVTHMTGLVTSFLLPLVHGGQSHIQGQWDPAEGAVQIGEHGCTVAVTATTFLQTLLDAYDPSAHDLSTLRLWICAGSPIPPAIIERAESTLPGVKVLSLYGRSENVTTTTCTTQTPREKSLTSDGCALPQQEVRIIDWEGREVPRGQEGDIAYRGAMHMLEYLKNPTETEALFTDDGFSRSGDLGVMDEDGFVRVTGRTKDIVIRGGMNISVRQIEDLLSQWSRVRACAAVAMPDAKLGEKVCLYLVRSDPSDQMTLEHVKEHLLGQGLTIRKVPERLEVVEELPMTATGKIQKHVLRAEIAEKLKAEQGA
ncbi:AMP-binding protein [Janibacter sp. YIM B02568]|uniref:AMP-binding protein n=1 Tax=Janibacter endophyticus TaxID=2806261 RepID=UPI0019508449|nr:AMP-binding protein [Janibacter endophyticus]MBM6545419.1 AMP-binding protein [Janibacter endophyticus]